MPRNKHIRSTASGTRVFPTLDPPLVLEPGDVVRIPDDVDLPETEVVTAKEFTGDGQAPLHVVAAEPGGTPLPGDINEPVDVSNIEPGAGPVLRAPVDPNAPAPSAADADGDAPTGEDQSA